MLLSICGDINVYVSVLIVWWRRCSCSAHCYLWLNSFKADLSYWFLNLLHCMLTALLHSALCHGCCVRSWTVLVLFCVLFTSWEFVHNRVLIKMSQKTIPFLHWNVTIYTNVRLSAAEIELLQMQNDVALRRLSWADKHWVLLLELSTTWPKASSSVVDGHPPNLNPWNHLLTVLSSTAWHRDSSSVVDGHPTSVLVSQTWTPGTSLLQP